MLGPTLPEPTKLSTHEMVLLCSTKDKEIDAYWLPSNKGLFFIHRETGFLIGNTVHFKGSKLKAEKYAAAKLRA
mgnify:CR=1 FL=1